MTAGNSKRRKPVKSGSNPMRGPKLKQRESDSPKETTMHEGHRQRTVAKGLRDMATLIGPETGVEITIGGQQVTPGLGLIDAAEDLLARAAELEEGVLRIAVAGVARGKSTLVSALLGKEVLPAGKDTTTLVPTEELQPYFDNLHRIVHEKIEREKERLHRVTGLKSASEARAAAEIKRLETIETCLTELIAKATDGNANA